MSEVHYMPSFRRMTLGNAGDRDGNDPTCKPARFTYEEAQGIVAVKVRIVLGSTTWIEGPVTMSLPMALEPVTGHPLDGYAPMQFLDVSTFAGSFTFWQGVAVPSDDLLSVGMFALGGDFAARPVTATHPFTWSAGDEIRMQMFGRRVEPAA